MRAAWCGFALGVIWLQRQAALPEWLGWCGLATLGVAGIVVAVWGLRGGAGFVCEGAGVAARGSGLVWSQALSPALARDLELAQAQAQAQEQAQEQEQEQARALAQTQVPRSSPALASLISRLRFKPRLRLFIGWSAVWCAAMCMGFGYAAVRAEMRLAASLPTAWEGRDIDVVGSIKGLPSHDENGARFLFEVEAADAPIAAPVAEPAVHFPRVIQLSWIADDAPAPSLEPGERWLLTVRLKRPHGNANFGVRDAEATLLARNVRATGYVSAPAHAVRLPGRARGLSVTVVRVRAALRARIDAVLADAPHRGIVVALAIGAQDEVSAADWLLMRGTGTSHLVAISGLHIGFVAGLAGWLAGVVWRRSGWLGRNWPLRLPAQIVAVTGGAGFAALHAALAGFNLKTAVEADGTAGDAMPGRRDANWAYSPNG